MIFNSIISGAADVAPFKKIKVWEWTPKADTSSLQLLDPAPNMAAAVFATKDPGIGISFATTNWGCGSSYDVLCIANGYAGDGSFSSLKAYDQVTGLLSINRISYGDHGKHEDTYFKGGTTYGIVQVYM